MEATSDLIKINNKKKRQENQRRNKKNPIKKSIKKLEKQLLLKDIYLQYLEKGKKESNNLPIDLPIPNWGETFVAAHICSSPPRAPVANKPPTPGKNIKFKIIIPKERINLEEIFIRKKTRPVKCDKHIKKN